LIIGDGGGQLTVTVKLQVLTPPQAFIAVQVTFVVPTLNVEPDGGSAVTVRAPPYALLAVTVKNTGTFVHELITISPGHLITGELVSTDTNSE
jgi:hypothetical protein